MKRTLTGRLATRWSHGIAAASFAIAAPASPVSAGGSQVCSSGDACVSWYGSGSTYWGFGSARINNLNAYYFNNGIAVGNNAGYGRNRDSGYNRVCFYKGINSTGGTSGAAPYSGSGWVLIQTTTESFESVQPSYCP